MLQAIELLSQNMVQRLTRRQPPENAFRLIQNAVATGPVEALTGEQVDAILREHRVMPGDAHLRFIVVYVEALRECVADCQITPQELAELEHLQKVFGLTMFDVQAAWREIVGPIYRDQLRSAATAGSLTDAAKAELETLAASLHLPATMIADIRKDELTPLVQRVLNAAIADKRLSPEEEAQVAAIAKNLDLVPTQDGETTRVLDRYRLLWRIDQGELPEVAVPIHLQQGEVCRLMLPATRFETRSATRAIGYAGPTVRIRLAKGVYWNMGRLAVNRETSEQWKEQGTGTLYVTSKRVLFDGSTRSIVLPLRRIIQFTMHTDGVQLAKDSGKDQLFTFTADTEVIGAVLGAVLRTA